MELVLMTYIFGLLFISHSASGSILCETGFCRNFLQTEECFRTSQNCDINNATHSGISLPSPTICNCCPYCLPVFGENQPCTTGGPGLGTTVGKCGDSLYCTTERDEHSCKRMESDCHKAQDDYDRRVLAGTAGALESRPHCDGKGNYASFYCIPAQTCFCQSEDGKRIFGEFLYEGAVTSRVERCACSRYHEKIKEILAPSVPFPVEAMRCTSDGNFNPIQCIDNICYCVDPITGVITSDDDKVDLEKDPITELPCYDKDIDIFPELSKDEPPYEYTTPCLVEVRETIEFIRESEADGYIMDYFTTVSGCMPDGNFRRIMTNRDGRKICVDERGQPIEDFGADPKTDGYETIDCKCAQTRHVMANSQEKPICCKNGNYRKIQCRRGVCRCVDSDGRQVGVESNNVESLDCFTDDWRNC